MKSWFKMSAQNGNAEIEIYDEIGLWGIGFKTFKAMLDDLGEVKNIKLRVNSPGGDILDGLAMYNVLKEHPAKVEAIVEGYAASIASYIIMAADKITMPGNTFLFIHNPFMYTVGDAESLKHDAATLEKMKVNIIAGYRSHAKDLSDADISKFMDDESWITAEDALTYGFADAVVDPIEAKNSIENKGKLTIPENVMKALTEKKTSAVTKIIKNQLPETGNNPPQKGKGAVVMNKCPKCGKDVAAEFGFCNHCGASMKVDTTGISAAHDKEVKEAKDLAIKEERNRVNEISARCRNFKLEATLEKELIDSGESLDKCIVKILDAIQKKAENPPAPGAGVTVDAADKFRTAASNSLSVSLRIEKDPVVVKSVQGQNLPRSLHNLIRACLRMEAKVSANRVDNMLPSDLATEAFRMAAAGSSDFPAILADVGNKQLLKAYTEAPVTFPAWCAEGEVPDFKSINLVKMSNFSDIDDIPEGFGFKEGKFSDNKETASVDTKGKKFSLTRKAIINDDLSAFARVLAAMMGAVRRRQNKDVYDKLCYNSLVGPAMADTRALFSETYHHNLKTSSGAISVANIAVVERKLLEMPLPAPENNSATQYANIPARYLLTGTANRLTAMQVLGSAFDLSFSTIYLGAQAMNPYNGGAITPIFDAYLQALLTAGSAANSWYLIADQNIMETFVMYYLAGNRVPTLRNEPSGVGEALGIAWDIFHDWGVGIPDHRGIVYADGK